MSDIRPKIDQWLDCHQEKLIRHTMDLVSIRSICRYLPGASLPFGSGCAQVLDEALKIAGGMGFETRNYDYYCGTATLRGRGPDRITLLVHLDTAPETDSWTIGPYAPMVRGGYLYGRGASDNKGAAIAALYVMRCLRDLEIQLEHSVELFFGCAKKSAMEDLDYYLRKEWEPAFALVADSNFPACIGEKGSLNGAWSCDVSGSNLVDFRGGSTANMVPDQVFALLSGLEFGEVEQLLRDKESYSVIPVDNLVKISTTGVGGHAAFPENTKNPVPKLANLLLECNLVTGSAVPVMRCLAKAFSNHVGVGLGLDMRSELFGSNTHTGGNIGVENGTLTQTVNVRYIPSLNTHMVNTKLESFAARHGLRYTFLSDTPPHQLPAELMPVAGMLTATCNGVLGTDLQNFTMGGVTYSKKLRNCIPFGPNRSDLPLADFEGRGGGHQSDESVRIQSLLDFVKIYVLSLRQLDQLLCQGLPGR